MQLWSHLQLDTSVHRVIALVGGGGKSSTLYTLARQARDTGRTVIVTTTTHILAHPALLCTDDGSPAHLADTLAQHGILSLGRCMIPGKLAAAGDVALCRQVADITLVEADGARGLSLKAPAAHEPVVPPCADAVLAVAGMDSVGQAVGAVCHRPEQVCALLGVSPDHRVTPGDVATLLGSPRGGRKAVAAGMAFRCVLNKADTPQRIEYAQEISRILQQIGIISIATQYGMEERGGKCLF